jgi:hypothetical protein
VQNRKFKMLSNRSVWSMVIILVSFSSPSSTYTRKVPVKRRMEITWVTRNGICPLAHLPKVDSDLLYFHRDLAQMVYVLRAT